MLSQNTPKSEKIILCIHPDIKILKAYMALLSDKYSADFILATAHHLDMVRDMIAQQHKQGNRFAVIVGSDQLKMATHLELLDKIYEWSPNSRQIMMLSNKENSLNGAFKKGRNLQRVMTFPFNEKDFILTVENAIRDFDQQEELTRIRQQLIHQETEIDRKIEDGIANAGERKSFLRALVQARLDYLGDIVSTLKKNAGNLDEIIEFFESIKTQMSTKEKARMAPGFYEIRNGISELTDWNANIEDTFLVNPRDFNLKFLVNQDLPAYTKKLAARKIQIKEDINSEMRVTADYHMILAAIRAFMQLLFDITKNEGKIFFLSRLNGTYVDLFIQNDGDSLSLDELKARLQQSGQSAAQILQDGQINLPTIQEFIQLNKGAIALDKVRDGSRIRISLPASKMYLTMQAAVKNAQPKYNLEHINVLLVDDTDINLMIILKQLTEYGLRITTCSNGYEAIQQAARIKFHYIFMDLVMPKLDGYAAAKIIKDEQFRLGASPKIIFQTSHAKMISKAKMKESGGDRILLKPLNRNLLNDIFWDEIKDLQLNQTGFQN